MSDALPPENGSTQVTPCNVGASMSLSQFPRGAEWRKWDLHLHTPGTAKEDHYKCSLEDFITELEKLSDVAVLGITDYWSIDNWQLLREEQINNQRLEGKLLIPNVELRITPVTNQNIPINLHVLFDPSISYGEIQRQFFQQLEFESRGCRYSATKSDLIALGRHLSGNELLEETAAWEKGIEQFQVPYSQIKEIVEKPYWQGKCLVGIANGSNDGASGIQESAMRESRCEIYRMADVIFSANERDCDYFLGKGCDPAAKVIRQYGSLKPCVMGSDAHSLERLRTWHQDKVTWIKADPTFDGLKQIVFEPEERFIIQECKPEEKPPYQVIDSITVNEESFWEQTIPVNQNLVTIIGGRSSGKSTLLTCLAERIDHPQQIVNDLPENQQSFIEGHKLSLNVTWADKSQGKDRRVDFFPQNYMIYLQEDDRKEERNQLIKMILIGNKTNKERFKTYEQWLISTKATLIAQCATLFAQRERLERLDAEIQEKGGLEGHIRAVETLELKLKDQKQRCSTLKPDSQIEFERVKQELEHLTSLRGRQVGDKNAISHLITTTSLWEIPPLDTTPFSDDLAQTLKEKHSSIWNQASSSWLSFLQSVLQSLEQSIQDTVEKEGKILEQEVYKNGKLDLESNSVLKELEQQLSEEKAKLAQLNLLVKERENLQALNQKLIREIASIHSAYYSECQKMVASIEWPDETLKIVGQVVPQTATLEERLEGQITRMTNAQKEYVASMVNHHTFDVFRFLDDIMNKRLALNQNVDEQALVTDFLSTNWFEIEYDLIYQGDSFNAMSPGKQAFVFLRLLLEFVENKCPILIDQPEDNLDNRAIFSELVQYLRTKKKERQIILVTHNPNVVVGADAEQVIVANQHGVHNENAGGTKFAYVSGSLENSFSKKTGNIPILESQGIREHVCEILEGGEDAFKKRENKYGFSS